MLASLLKRRGLSVLRGAEPRPAFDEAWARAAAGNQLEAIGTIELEMLKFYGLKPEHYLIDVGCGPGRLTLPASRYLTGPYLGTDVIADRVAYTRQLVRRPNWRIELVAGAKIPEVDGRADMVCMFSVATHLPDELTFLYLQEAKRVLRPGGLLLFSFLELRMPAHWIAFETNLTFARTGAPIVDFFLDRETIGLWAGRTGLAVVAIRDGSEAFVPLPHPVITDEGHEISGHACLGQSICVLRA